MISEALTLDAELDRQLKAVRRGESDTVVCPWHGMIVTAEDGNCCVEMEEARDRLGKAHLQSIERQVSGIRRGLRDHSVQCPYCDGINRPENMESVAHWKRPNVSPYCCDLFYMATIHLADRQVIQDRIDHKRRIDDMLAEASAN